MEKWGKNKKISNTQESQEVSPFLAGGRKATMNRRDSMADTIINNKKNPQKKHRLGTVSSR